jgi:hypothetical protein
LATAAQLWNQVILLALAVTCPVTFVLLARRPLIGWRIAGVLGIFGAVMLCLYGRSLWLLAQSGGTANVASVAIFSSLWCALVIAGVCSVGRNRQPTAVRGET